jgi:hypothetical protein
MADAELPQWLNEIDLGTVAVLTLDDGECLTADILRLNAEGGELIVDVVSSNRRYAKSAQRGRANPCQSRCLCRAPAPCGATVAIL